MKKKCVKKISWLCLCFIFFTVLLSAQDYAVGKITSFTGEIWLDPFGNGNFTRIEKAGEPLYKNSIIKTSNTSEAMITVMDMEKNIFPQSQVSVAKIMNLETRKKNAAWFNPLVDILQRITGFLFPGEKSVDFISRGEEKLSAYEKLFRFEEEGDESTGYIEELNFLLKIQDLKKSGYTSGEYAYRKGFCYFQLGNYETAARLFDAAYEDTISKNNVDVPWYTNSLFLINGITHYMLAEYEKSVIFLEKFINRSTKSEYAPYASWLLLDSLVNLKKQDKVQQYLEKVSNYFKDHRYKAEFTAYLDSIK